MVARDAVGAVEIGNGAGDPENSVIAAGCEVKALGGAEQEFTALVVEKRDLIQEFAFGIGAKSGFSKLAKRSA